MLGNIFYFLGLFLFFISLSKTFTYFKFIDIKEWVTKFNKITGKNPEKGDFRSEREYSFFVGFGCLSLIESFWLICGILSKSWILFAIMILSGLLLRKLSNYISFPIQKLIGFSFNLIKSALILLLCLNHFHFHEDILKYLFR